MEKGLVSKVVAALVIMVVCLGIVLVIIHTSAMPSGESLACQARLKEQCIDFINDGGCMLESSLLPVSDGYVDSATANCSMGTDNDTAVLEHCCKIQGL